MAERTEVSPSPPSSERRDYTPDFCLPEGGGSDGEVSTGEIWIEVWACDERENRFPQEIDAEDYKAGMAWKRALHAEHGTPLVELFQNEIWGGRLDKTLAGKLADAGFARRPLSLEPLARLITSTHDGRAPIINLLSSFLSLYRAGGWSQAEVEQRAESSRDRGFLRLFWPLLSDYQDALRAEEKIDFDAMLLGASTAIANGFDAGSYRYILVDEFQDISRARMDLVRGMRRNAAACRLFLVGDDWQSIYRFTGSDLSYFTGVEKHLGATARTDLGRTFRLLPAVTEVSSRFVTRNRAQLTKMLTPRDGSIERPAVVIRLHGPGREEAALRETLREIGQSTTEPVSVLVLGRYNHRLPALDELERAVDGLLTLQSLTVHRAKGLEADHVIVVGLESGAYGFPSEIEDDRVLQMLLGAEEKYPNAEERRVFYVALTRTRSKVHLLANAQQPSAFVQELLEDGYADWVEVVGEESERYRCPRCSGRTVRLVQGPSGSFFGCGHYPACRGRLPVCPECGEGVLQPWEDLRSGAGHYTCVRCRHQTDRCGACGVGAIVRRTGPHSAFLGCSEWRPDGRGCGYTGAI